MSGSSVGNSIRMACNYFTVTFFGCVACVTEQLLNFPTTLQNERTAGDLKGFSERLYLGIGGYICNDLELK